MSDQLRVGLVGTGHWARVTQGAALASTAGVELAAVWGRDATKTESLAHDLGTRPYAEVDDMLAEVDAVAFAVPPDVQADIAVRAAQAGRHLLLEKPIATSVPEADRLVHAVDAAGVSSIVFFTARFQPEHRAWLEAVAEAGEWDGGSALWLAGALVAGSPYVMSSWRHEKGALWDIGPHALAALTGALGRVSWVRAVAGRGDLVHLVVGHESGATSTATLTLNAPPDAQRHEVTVWGDPGTSFMPASTTTALDAFGIAASELADCVRSGRPHPVDVHFGRDVVAVLADAQGQLAEAPTPVAYPT